MSTRKRGPAADTGHHCPVICQSPTQDAEWHGVAGLQNSSRSYKSEQILLSNVNYQRDPWQTLAAAVPLHLSIADSGHSGQRVTASYRQGVIPSRRHTVTASRRHTVTASYRRSCSPLPSSSGQRQ